MGSRGIKDVATTSTRLRARAFSIVVLGGVPLAVALPHDARADDGWQVQESDPPEPIGSSRTEALAGGSKAEPVDPADKPVQVELSASAAYGSAPIRGGTSPFGAGVGGRFGLDISGVYVGASALYYLGSSDYGLSDRALLYGLELGYGFHFHWLGNSLITIRPLVGFGDAAISHTDPSLAKVDVVTSASGSSSSTSSDTITVNNIYLKPGITTMVSAGSNFVALNTSLLVIPGLSYGGGDPTTWLSYGVQAEVGFRF